MSVVEKDLRYRVSTVRVWFSEEGINGIQLVFRHYEKDEERVGELKLTSRVAANETPTVQIDIVDGEFLVRVEASQHRDGVVTHIVLRTSSNRSITCGHIDEKLPRRRQEQDALSGTSIPEVELNGEVRKITVSFSPGNKSITQISTTREGFPDSDKTRLAVASACSIPESNISFKLTCDLLCTKLDDCWRLLEGVQQRGIIVPVAFLVEFEDIVQKSDNILRWCRSNFSGLHFTRFNRLEEYIQACTRLETCLQTRVPKAEHTCLSEGEPIRAPTPKSAEDTVSQLITLKALRTASVFYRLFGARLCPDKTFSKLVKALAKSDHVRELYGVILARATAKNVPVVEVMARFSRWSAELIDRAIEHGCHEVVELLVLNAQFDPLGVDSTSDSGGVHGSQGNQLVVTDTTQRRSRRFDQLIQLVEGIEDEEAYDSIKMLLESFKNRDDFQAEVLRISQLPQDDHSPSSEEAMRDLKEVVPKITRVYDISSIYSLSKAYIESKDAQKELFISACQHVFENKLVFDNRDCAFMSLALEHVENEGLLSKFEACELKIQNTQVNMESAKWVIELKSRISKVEQRSIHVEKRLDALQHVVSNVRSALIYKNEAHLKIANARKVICAIALPIFLAGGELLALAGGALLDYSNRRNVLKCCLMSDDRSFVSKLGGRAQPRRRWLFRPEFAKVLTRAKVDVTHFLEVLKRWPAETQDDFPVPEVQLDDNIDENVNTPDGLLTVDLCGLSNYPYFSAVRDCKGDLREFQRLADAYREDPSNDPSAMMLASLVRPGQREPEEIRLSVNKYAEYLGYRSVAQYWEA